MAGSCDTVANFRVLRNAGDLLAEDLLRSQEGVGYVELVTVLVSLCFNPLTPNHLYSGRTAPLTSKRYILYIYSTNTGTEYF